MQKIVTLRNPRVNISLKLSIASILLCNAQAPLAATTLSAETIAVIQQNPSTPLSVAASSGTYSNGKNISCYGAADGTASAQVSGGFEPYSFSWSTGATTPNISGLSAGTYTVLVTDAQGQTSTASVVLSQPNQITISATASSPVICPGASTQLITSSNAGPNASDIPFPTTSNSPILDYQTTTSSVAVSGISPNLVGPNTISGVTINLHHTFCGDVSVWLTAPNGTSTMLTNRRGGSGDNYLGACFAQSASTPISQGNASFTGLWLPEESFSNMYGSTVNGTWTLNVKDNAGLDQGQLLNWTLTLQNAGAVYTWSPSASLSLATSASPVASPAVSTNYYVTVTDINGCSATTNVAVQVNSLPVFTALANDISCFGEANGSITLSPSAGNAPFSYSVNNGQYQSDATFANLQAGSYSVKMKDNNGCVSSSETFTISQPDPIFAFGYQNYDYQPVGVCDGPTGAIELYLEGGVAPFIFNWSNGATVQNPVGVIDGYYEVLITDANGCQTFASAEVYDATGIELLTVAGQANNVSCNGGSNGHIDVSVSGGTAPYTFAWSNGATTEDISGLFAGVYSVTVTDANGCSVVSSFSITEPVVLTATVNATVNGPNNASAEAIVNGGTAPYTYSWSNGVSASTLAGLSSGTYAVTVTDTNGCSATASTSIVAADPLTIAGNALVKANGYNVSCFGSQDGSINITVNGGVGPFNYAWSNGAATEDAANLAAGNYYVTVTDQAGSTATASFTITQPSQIIVNAGSDNMTYLGYAPEQCATLSGSVTGGNGPISWLWSNNATSNSITVCPTTPTTYTLTATDANGCQASDNVLVYAVDVRCGNGKNNDKVLVCVNTQNNPHTICVSQNAVAAHLANGGYLGNCQSNARMMEDKEETTAIELSAFPNPFTNNTTISLSLSNESDVQVQIFDINGKMVQELFAGRVEGGVNYQYELTGDKLPAGMYICRLISGNESANVKLVLTR